MDFKFDFTLGNVVAIVTLLGIYGHAAFRLSRLETKLNIIFSWFSKHIMHSNGDIEKFFGGKD